MRPAVMRSSSASVSPSVPAASAPPRLINVPFCEGRSVAVLAPAFTVAAMVILSPIKVTPPVPVTPAFAWMFRTLSAPPVLPAVRLTAPLPASTSAPARSSKIKMPPLIVVMVIGLLTVVIPKIGAVTLPTFKESASVKLKAPVMSATISVTSLPALFSVKGPLPSNTSELPRMLAPVACVVAPACSLISFPLMPGPAVIPTMPSTVAI